VVERIVSARLRLLFGLCALSLVAFALPSRAQEKEPEEPLAPDAGEPAPAPTPKPTPTPATSTPPRDEPGFGQAPDEAPRLPRIRLEGAFAGAWFDSLARIGHTGASNSINPHDDLHVPRWLVGERGLIVLKFHRWFAAGIEYLEFSGEGASKPVRRDVRIGGNVPTEVPQGFRASGVLEWEETHASARLVLADDAQIRAELVLGAAWARVRLGVHPQGPWAPTPLPGFGQPKGTSRSVGSIFFPTLGLFLAWNPIEELGFYLEEHTGYLGMPVGTYNSVMRGGIRLHVFRGLEVLLGAFIVDGQFYDVHDRYENRARGHIFRQVRWLGGGPDVGLSFTY
jgi:hypothetical protein